MATYRNAGLFVVLSVLWGTAFMAIKVGLADLPPILFAAIRYDVAGVLVLGYVVAFTDDWRPRSKADWLTVVTGGVLIIALYNAFLFVGQQGVTSGVAAILVATNPILATAFARGVLSDERLDLVGILGLLVGIGGVVVIARPAPDALLGADTVASGLVLLAAASVALGSVLVQRLEAGIAAEGMVAWSTVLGALLLHAISLAVPTESVAQATFTPAALAALAYLAVFASAVGYVIYFDLLDRVGAIEINLISYATPVPAAVAGWLVLGEVVGSLAIVGFLLILGGFALLKRDGLRRAFVR